ncbi:MAG: DUF1592 domain-containing protein [Myxococcota bacterium]|nr:DUF1592 domain-containing protein [Myxococcota bacterium]
MWLFVAALGCQGTVDSDGVPPAEYAGDPGTPPDPGNPGNPGPGTGSDPGTTPPGGDPTPGTPASCATPNPGTAPLRRLSNAEYKNTLSDLFTGVDGVNADIDAAVKELPPEAESLGFRNSAEFLTVQSLVAQKYMDAAERIAARAAKSDGLVPCQPEAGNELTCGKQFIAAFGAKAYRHPLTPEQSARLETTFQKGLTDYGFEAAVEWVVYAVLQSPEFLYRVEAGKAGGAAGVTQPTPNELAVRLSYLFWQSTPDQALLDAASSGGLDSKELVAAKAREMLADPRSARLFQYFAEWLDLDRLEEFSRDPKIFEDLPAELPSWFQSESRTFVNQLMANGGDFHELFTAPYTFANRGLAEHYGLEPGAGDGFVRVSAPTRSGILTQAFLSTHDKANRTSIVRRGLKVRTDLLCNNVPAPPNDVALDLEGLGEGLSQKQKLERHRAEATCAGCHTLMDPIGVVFENFDAVGRERTVDESGQAIVTATTLTSTRDMDGPIADVRELGEKLAASAEARECYVTQTFRFFFGREVEPADACTIQHLRTKFAENPKISELLVELTQTDAFLYRPVIEVQP